MSGASGGGASAAGVDAGATLAKLAVQPRGGPVRYRLAPIGDLDAVAEAVAAEAPARVGLTGGAAPELAERLAARLGDASARVNEFAAWGRGARELLGEAEAAAGAGDRFLLVSVGTGTSVMLADGLAVSRVGGTALGGGTVVGLGALLLGRGDFDGIAALASRGARRRVDLLVSDIYRPGEIPLVGELTAANFGRLARGTGAEPAPAPEDLAHALMGLVGETIALVCGGLGAAHGVRRVAFGGSTLRENPALAEVLRTITTALGLDPVFLPAGEFAGALGALRLASAE